MSYYVMFFYLLGRCDVGGDIGDGTAQGTCVGEDHRCQFDGKCIGKHYYKHSLSLSI